MKERIRLIELNGEAIWLCCQISGFHTRLIRKVILQIHPQAQQHPHPYEQHVTTHAGLKLNESQSTDDMPSSSRATEKI